jgi:diguanylate cyclase (GGDEF)-like protein/PAS domain S-box-containing protein
MKGIGFLKSKRNFFTVYGFLVGLTFPIGAMVFEAIIHGDQFSKALVVHYQLEHPVFWFIEVAPIVLGLLGGIIGVQRDKIENQARYLESRVIESTRAAIKQKEYFEALVQNAPLGIITMDDDHRIITSNKSIEMMFGFLKTEIIGHNLDELITTEDMIEDAAELTEKVRNGEIIHETRQRKRKDGQLIDVEISAVPILSGGEQIGVLGIYEDITERKEIEDKYKYLSFHDALTGLYNRAYFENELLRLESSRQFPVSIFVFDMDNLKQINDTKGHSAGDKAIRSAASLLEKVFRVEDMIARIGGDEFVAILPKTEGETVERIIERTESSIKLYNQNKMDDDQSQSVSFSMGVATVQKDQSLLEGYKLADERMYEEKQKKKE